MRSADGRHFTNVVGMIDRDREHGLDFEPNVFECNKPVEAGDMVHVGERIFEYLGDDNLGHSIFREIKNR